MPTNPRRLTILDAQEPGDVKAELERHLAESGEGVEAEAGLSAPLLVGDLARATGKTVRAIHLYEDLGLLKPADRSKGRYRLFTMDALVRVRWITKLQSLGLSLSQIQEVVQRLEEEPSARGVAARLRDIYATKVAETRAKVAELRALERELEATLQFLSICESACPSEVPTHSCPTCERHPETPSTPELVVGAQSQ
jgi:DNA-binding transcriptional MerR regulator